LTLDEWQVVTMKYRKTSCHGQRYYNRTQSFGMQAFNTTKHTTQEHVRPSAIVYHNAV